MIIMTVSRNLLLFSSRSVYLWRIWWPLFGQQQTNTLRGNEARHMIRLDVSSKLNYVDYVSKFQIVSSQMYTWSIMMQLIFLTK